MQKYLPVSLYPFRQRRLPHLRLFFMRCPWLDLLILRTVNLQPMHGWAIAKRIQQVSREVLQVQQGSLYPALHRLGQQGWIRAKWAESETGRQAKFYSLTAAGHRQLEQETENWNRLSSAINWVIEGV